MTCQKINKLSFLCDTKNLVSFLVHHNLFIFSFYITHCQHVDLLSSGTGKKETFSPSFTHLSDIPKQLLSKSCSRKKFSYYLGLMFVKRLREAPILVKLQACFSQILQKLIPQQVFFQDFTQILSNLSLYAIFPEDFPMKDSVNFVSFE